MSLCLYSISVHPILVIRAAAAVVSEVVVLVAVCHYINMSQHPCSVVPLVLVFISLW